MVGANIQQEALMTQPTESKSDWIDDKCAACAGTGYRPDLQRATRDYAKLLATPVCEVCSGTGRKKPA
jgi:DnaJ-class molecular chaperone